MISNSYSSMYADIAVTRVEGQIRRVTIILPSLRSAWPSTQTWGVAPP
jgi:hypothetical protein